MAAADSLRSRLFRQPGQTALGLFFLVVTFVNIARIVENNRYVYGAGDFYVYWHAGQYLRQRTNPYISIQTPQEPRLPITFFDGNDATRLPEPWTGLGIPTITAPLIWLFSLFSLFSWDVAKMSWMAANLGLGIIIPLLLIQLLPGKKQWLAGDKVLFVLLFMALGAVRSTGGNGQTSLLIFVLLLATIRWAVRHPWLAGVAFGIALAKYSLALPLLPVLVLRRRWRLLATALATQLLAAWAIAIWSGSSMATILWAYAQTLLRHAPLPGIHLAYAFPVYLGDILTIVMIAAVPGALFFLWQKRSALQGTASERQTDLELLAVLSLWILLIAYHGRYDAVIVLLYYALLWDRKKGAMTQPEVQRTRSARLLGVLPLASLVPMIIPITFSLRYPPLPAVWWARIYYALFSLTLLGMLLHLTAQFYSSVRRPTKVP